MRSARHLSRIGLVCLLAASTAACSPQTGQPPPAGRLLVVVSAPVTSQPWVGRFTVNGAKLAVAQVNRAGGVDVGGGKHRQLAAEVIDNQGSAQQAVEAARRAVAEHALALVTDGVGAAAVSAVTGPAHLPVFVVFEGGASVVDADQRPTIFRVAPADKPMATRLADYVANRKPKVAMLTDTTGFGSDGRAALRIAFARDQIPVRADIAVDPGASALDTQVLQAQRSGADTLVVWARASIVAQAVRSVRSNGWAPRIFASPTAEDPLVRQQLADHPTWLDGVAFVSFRITAEVGPEPFATFRAAYESQFGVEKVGVTFGAKPVLSPPDWAMYPYDAVRLVAAAAAKSRGVLGTALMDALESTVVTGANGDERGFTHTTREGVSPDDMYFGRFRAMRFVPVTDDILSTGLPVVPQ